MFSTFIYFQGQEKENTNYSQVRRSWGESKEQLVEFVFLDFVFVVEFVFLPSGGGRKWMDGDFFCSWVCISSLNLRVLTV